MYGSILIAVASVLFWILSLYAYRLIFHPLAKYPGPKLAAATRWYEFYYDIVLQGQYIFHLQELHKKYGPIIRISPEELHINDPDFVETLYAKSGRLHKYDRDSIRFGVPTSVFTTSNAELHRIRRASLNSFFSRRAIVSFEDAMFHKVDQMVSQIAKYRGSKKPLTISHAFMALAGDVIMKYCYDYDYNHVNSDGFETNFHELLVTASQSGQLAVHFPILMKIIMNMPEWFVVWSTPLFALLFKLQKSVEKDVQELKQKELESDFKDGTEHTTVVQHLLRSDLPPAEKEDDRLRDEAQNFVGAGASTTGWSLGVTTFYIIQNRKVYAKLRKELETLIPDPKDPEAFQWSKLEKAEYLTACIKEGIRLARPVSGRSIRLSDNIIGYEKWEIPPRTPVGMTLVDVSYDEDIFPEASTFKPERWLGDMQTKSGEPMDKYWFGFGRGVRSCMGMNLAWLEMYVALAAVFRNFDFDLFETDLSDVVLKHDYMIGCPKLNSKGIRVWVKN